MNRFNTLQVAYRQSRNLYVWPSRSHFACLCERKREPWSSTSFIHDLITGWVAFTSGHWSVVIQQPYWPRRHRETGRLDWMCVRPAATRQVSVVSTFRPSRRLRGWVTCVIVPVASHASLKPQDSFSLCVGKAYLFSERFVSIFSGHALLCGVKFVGLVYCLIVGSECSNMGASNKFDLFSVDLVYYLFWSLEWLSELRYNDLRMQTRGHWRYHQIIERYSSSFDFNCSMLSCLTGS